MRRNLVCHLLPRSRGRKWLRTVSHLKQRWPLFNGKKIIAIVRAPDCDSPDEVRAAFNDPSIEFLEFDNDQALREVISFVPMLSRVESLDPNEITFCCHGKGATHGHDDSICHCWADVMFSACLDYPELVECALKDKATCGAFRMFGAMCVDWHFSGSFYWIRHDRTFSRNWRNIPQEWAGTEKWPGVQFNRGESACLFLDNPTHSIYDENYWEQLIFPSFHHWQASLRSLGLCTIPYFPPQWFQERHPNFRLPIGLGGTAMTRPEKRNWSPLSSLRRLAANFSTRWTRSALRNSAPIQTAMPPV